jgi:hypothetical protein
MPPKLLDEVRTVARVKHFSLSTERAYVSWIRRFILFHHKRHPREMGDTSVHFRSSCQCKNLSINPNSRAQCNAVSLPSRAQETNCPDPQCSYIL